MRHLYRFLDVLRAEMSPNTLASGALAGILLGLLPVLSFEWAFLALGCIIFRFHPFSVISFSILSSLLSSFLDPLFNTVGLYFLKSAMLRQNWAWLYHAPFIPYTQFNNSTVLGMGLLFTPIALPLFFIFRYVIQKKGPSTKAYLLSTAIGSAILSSGLIRRYREYREDLANG